MARKLPWNSDGSSEPSKLRSKRGPSTASTGRTHIKQGASEPNTPKKPRRPGRSHSPSTSPIPQPTQQVPQVESMRPHDDTYMMVEDEFESVARTFTAHLHAAEYARLKAKARTAPPPRRPLLTGTASASRDAERKELRDRQGGALKRLRSTEGDDDEDVVIGDLWSGTSLAGLMDGVGGESGRTSLSGLQRPVGATRAARGFARANSGVESKGKGKTIEDIFGDFAAGSDDGGRTGLRRDGPEPVNGKKREDTVRQRVTTKQVTNRDSALALAATTTATPKPRPDPKQTLRRSRVYDLSCFDDDDDEIIPYHETAAAKPASSHKRVVTPVKKEKGNDRKERLDEVPVFLV